MPAQKLFLVTELVLTWIQPILDPILFVSRFRRGLWVFLPFAFATRHLACYQIVYGTVQRSFRWGVFTEGRHTR